MLGASCGCPKVYTERRFMLYWLGGGGPLPFECRCVVEKDSFLARRAAPSSEGRGGEAHWEGKGPAPGKSKPIYAGSLSRDDSRSFDPLIPWLSLDNKAKPGLNSQRLGKVSDIPPLKKETDGSLDLLGSGSSATVNRTSAKHILYNVETK